MGRFYNQNCTEPRSGNEPLEPIQTKVNNEQIDGWIQNFLQLNGNKTEVIIFVPIEE